MLGENQRKLEIAQYVQYRFFWCISKHRHQKICLLEQQIHRSACATAQSVRKVNECFGKQKGYAIEKSAYGSNSSRDQTMQSVILSIAVKRFMSVLKL